MEETKLSADLEIRSDSVRADGLPTYSVKLDGHEISQFVKGLTLDINACDVAELRLRVNTEKISVNSRCLVNVPEPYGSYIRYKNEDPPKGQGESSDGP